MRSFALFMIVAAGLTTVCSAETARDRMNHARHSSEEGVEVPGGKSIGVPMPIDRAFELVLNGLKRDGTEISEADRTVGRIVTGIAITGGWTQTGRRLVVVFIKDAPNQTTVRVTATVQTRHQLMGATKPWSAPKLDSAETSTAADKVKALLSGAE